MTSNDAARRGLPGRRHHAAIWYLQKDPRLSPNAERDIDVALGNGHPVYVPSISVVELIHLIDKGRIPEAAFDLVTQVLRDVEPAPRHV